MARGYALLEVLLVLALITILAGTAIPLPLSSLDQSRTAAAATYVSSGALIETEWRLLPGTPVELQLGEPVALYKVKGRIVRCHVSLLGRERIRYRGAAREGNERPDG